MIALPRGAERMPAERPVKPPRPRSSSIRKGASDASRRRAHILSFIAALAFMSAEAGAQGTMDTNVDLKGDDYRGLVLASPQPRLCQEACINDIACRAWTFVRPGLQGPQARCWLKFAVPKAGRDGCCTSGVVRPLPDIQALVPRSNTRRLSVVPILFLPSDNQSLTGEDVERHSALLMAHLVTAQKFYKDMLETDTFAIASPSIFVYRAMHPDAYYAKRLTVPKGEPDAPHLILREIFDWRRETRQDSSAVYVIVYARTSERQRGEAAFGGGRTFNGPPGSGGGSLELELTSLTSDTPTFFQAALIHELGHAFGLVHVDCFGYDQRNNPSVMSYDPRWDTRGLASSRGRFGPEDFFMLAQNKLAFPHFQFVRAKHDPDNRRHARPACKLGAMTSHIGLKGNGPKCLVYPCP